jgi:hypothetical protein
MSSHLGQKIFTVLFPGRSLVPRGRQGWPSHNTRGQRPKSQLLWGGGRGGWVGGWGGGVGGSPRAAPAG